MMNALVTLPFLLALAIAVAVMWDMVASNWHKALAALQGRSPLAEAPIVTRPVKVRYASRQAPVRVPVRSAAQQRVAA